MMIIYLIRLEAHGNMPGPINLYMKEKLCSWIYVPSREPGRILLSEHIHFTGDNTNRTYLPYMNKRVKNPFVPSVFPN